jgi:hypothetical protein
MSSPARAAARRVVPVGLRRRLLLAAVRHAPYRFGLVHIGAIFGTNKAGDWRTGESYCDVYERYLRPRRRRSFTLLEIGVEDGLSLRMWDTYFPRARIIGLDIDPRAPQRVPEFEVITASQDDPDELANVIARYPDLEVVVDDGSHYTGHIISTFELLFPRLPSGALYAIEDLDASYKADYGGYRDLNPEVARNDRADFNRFLNGLVRDCDVGGEKRRVAFVHLWPTLAVVGRA